MMLEGGVSRVDRSDTGDGSREMDAESKGRECKTNKKSKGRWEGGIKSAEKMAKRKWQKANCF
jgi:hypothetical protein